MSPIKKTTRRRRPSAATARARTKKSAAALETTPPAEPSESAIAIPDASPEERGIPVSSPEPIFAARVPPPEAERPFPEPRREIFFDVENTSRAQHIARMLDHLRIDRRGHRTEFIAVGNWRVIGHDTARLLAQHGAYLVHSAPSVGVRDWSDLRIAVAAGAWLASARPGDVIEIVSDDRAFDAVGDVAASLGITYRRLSYRALAGAPAEELPAPSGERGEPVARPHGGEGRRRGRRRGRGGRRGGPPPHAAPAAHPTPPAHAGDGRQPAEPHTAPHDEIVGVVRELMRAAADRPVTIDMIANTLKSRGFSRPPGSPRLITRLRRIKEIEVSRSGMITLAGAAAEPAEPERGEPQPREVVATIDRDEIAADNDAPEPGNEKLAPALPAAAVPGARRRRRRGGRRRGGRGRGQPVP